MKTEPNLCSKAGDSKPGNCDELRGGVLPSRNASGLMLCCMEALQDEDANPAESKRWLVKLYLCGKRKSVQRW